MSDRAERRRIERGMKRIEGIWANAFGRVNGEVRRVYHPPSRSKYKPHQGYAECERRRGQ